VTANDADRRALAIADEACTLLRARFAAMRGAEALEPLPRVVDGQPWVEIRWVYGEIGYAGETAAALADSVAEAVNDVLIENAWWDS